MPFSSFRNGALASFQSFTVSYNKGIVSQLHNVNLRAPLMPSVVSVLDLAGVECMYSRVSSAGKFTLYGIVRDYSWSCL